MFLKDRKNCLCERSDTRLSNCVNNRGYQIRFFVGEKALKAIFVKLVRFVEVPGASKVKYREGKRVTS